MAKYSKGQERRAKIVTEATKIFGTRGYIQSSIQSIAEASQISQSAVHYHFSTKLALFRAVVSAMIEDNAKIIEDLIEINDNAYDKLMKHFEGNYIWAVNRKYNAQIMTCIYYTATVDSSFRTFYTNILTAARSKLLEILLAGEREKIFSFELKPDHIAQLLNDQLLGSLVNTVAAHRDESTYRQLRENWRAMMQKFANVTAPEQS